VVHYCVTNIPAAVPHTSTLALTNATFPYVLRLAKDGIQAALRSHKDIHDGVNTYQGKLTYKAVADSQQRPWTPIADLI
jgi:alanine dehydrogenase